MVIEREFTPNVAVKRIVSSLVTEEEEDEDRDFLTTVGCFSFFCFWRVSRWCLRDDDGLMVDGEGVDNADEGNVSMNDGVVVCDGFSVTL